MIYLNRVKNKLFLFLYGLAFLIRINLIGLISVSEICALSYFPFSIIKRFFRTIPVLKKIAITYLVLLLSFVLSDIVNGSDPADYLRGWAIMIFSFISFWFILSQIRENVRYFVFLLAGTFFTYFIWGGEGSDINLLLMEENTNYFKVRIMGFANPAVILISYCLCIRKHKLLALLTLFVYALICIVLDARSNSLVFFIALALLWFKFYRIKINRSFILIWLFFFMVISYMAYYYYVEQVLHHDFGGSNAQTQLSRATNPYNPFELLYQGRSDVFIVIEVIKDRPVLGYGSWSKISKELEMKLYINQFWREYAARGSEKGYIPSHSVLLTAWLWGGILAFLAILYLFYLFVKMSVSVYKRCDDMPILLIITPLFIEIIWHFCFSPFGHLRTSIPFILALVTVTYSQLPARMNTRKEPVNTYI